MLSFRTINNHKDKKWVIFLHGLGGNSNIWYKQIESFQKHFNLLLIDFFGHGATRESRDEYTYEILGDEVIKIMDHLEIDKAHLLGISLGTIIANAILKKNPDRIYAMIQGGAVLGFDFRARFLLKMGNLLRKVSPYMWLYKFFAFIMMPKKNHLKSRQIFAREATKLGRQEFMKWYKLMQKLTQFYKGFKTEEFNVPKLYITGGEDHLFLPILKAQFKNDQMASLYVIEKCGHVCNIERDNEFNEVAIEYLSHYPYGPTLEQPVVQSNNSVETWEPAYREISANV